MFALTDQISGQIHKVGIVLIDELHHSSFQQLVVKLQVLPHLLQLDLLPTLCHELIHVEVILKTETKRFKRRTDICDLTAVSIS